MPKEIIAANHLEVGDGTYVSGENLFNTIVELAKEVKELKEKVRRLEFPGE